MSYVAYNRGFKYEVLNVTYKEKQYLSHFLGSTSNFLNVTVWYNDVVENGGTLIPVPCKRL